jgi:hypothetical protein
MQNITKFDTNQKKNLRKSAIEEDNYSKCLLALIVSERKYRNSLDNDIYLWDSSFNKRNKVLLDKLTDLEDTVKGLNCKSIEKKNKSYHKQNPHGVYIVEDCWGIIKEFLGLKIVNSNIKPYYIKKYFPTPKLFKPFQISIRSGSNTKFVKRTPKNLKSSCLTLYKIQKDTVSEYIDIYGYRIRPDFKLYPQRCWEEYKTYRNVKIYIYKIK